MTLEELENYFASIIDLPQTVQVNKGEKIIDVPKFIESHLAVLRYNGENNKSFAGFKARLIQLKEILEGEAT